MMTENEEYQWTCENCGCNVDPDIVLYLGNDILAFCTLWCMLTWIAVNTPEGKALLRDSARELRKRARAYAGPPTAQQVDEVCRLLLRDMRER